MTTTNRDIIDAVMPNQEWEECLYLGIDTETTGFKRKGELIQENQARVCQIAMVLADHTGKPLTKFSSLIKPDGWIIGEGAKKVHGISDEMCERTGISMKSVFALYVRLTSMSDIIVAHNADFDRGMMKVEEAYYNAPFPVPGDETTMCQPPITEVVKDWYCTMKTNTHITSGKWPKLEEALQHYCGRSVGENAHDALVDTEACLDVFFAMRKKVAA